MNRVVIESPLKGVVPGYCPRFLASLWERFERHKNRRYAFACMLDSLHRGEAPYASHVLFDQPGLLNDANSVERKLGMDAGFAWGEFAERRAFYCDRGVSGGMKLAVKKARDLQQNVEIRFLGPPWCSATYHEAWMRCKDLGYVEDQTSRLKWLAGEGL